MLKTAENATDEELANEDLESENDSDPADVEGHGTAVSGTSYSSPYIAAAAAKVKYESKSSKPTNNEIITTLKNKPEKRQ